MDHQNEGWNPFTLRWWAHQAHCLAIIHVLIIQCFVKWILLQDFPNLTTWQGFLGITGSECWWVRIAWWLLIKLQKSLANNMEQPSKIQIFSWTPCSTPLAGPLLDSGGPFHGHSGPPPDLLRTPRTPRASPGRMEGVTNLYICPGRRPMAFVPRSYAQGEESWR